MLRNNAQATSIRAFIGIPLDDAFNDQCELLVAQLKRRLDEIVPHHDGQGVRWTSRESRHMTLAFLDQITGQQARMLSTYLSQSLGSIRCFDLLVNGVGAFPNARGPIIALRFTPSEPLSQLFEHMQTLCQTLELRRENKPFRPHITLGRAKGRRSLPRLLFPPDPYDPIIATYLGRSVSVTRLQLIQSQFTQEGSRYQVLSEHRLNR